MTQAPLCFSPEVAQARAEGRALVALESTIITHGMPWPQNRDTARLVEQDIRDAGAVPATIAILDGLIHIGLDAPTLDRLAQAQDVMKLSRADLAVCLATGRMGATTVAATMLPGRKPSWTFQRPWKCLKPLVFPLSPMGRTRCRPSGRATLACRRLCAWIGPPRSPSHTGCAPRWSLLAGNW